MKLTFSTSALLCLLPLTSILGAASPITSRSDLSGNDLFAPSATDLVISSIPNGDGTETEGVSKFNNNADVSLVTNEETFDVYLRPDDAEKKSIENRQISPWPHFRECKPNDPRPECHQYKKPQVSPWPHFRQCTKNDPRPECPHRKRIAGIGEEDFGTEKAIVVPRASK